MIDLKDDRFQSNIDVLSSLFTEVKEFGCNVEITSIKYVIEPTKVSRGVYDSSPSHIGYVINVRYDDGPEWHYKIDKHGISQSGSYIFTDDFHDLCGSAIPAGVYNQMVADNYFIKRIRLNKLKQVL